MLSDELFSLLFARLQSNDLFRPSYIGEFVDRAALPRRRRYPPLFAWIDRAGDLHFDVDRVALARICVTESIRAGQPVTFGDAEVEQVVTRFQRMAADAANATLRANAAALNNLKSARSRAAARWGVQS